MDCLALTAKCWRQLQQGLGGNTWQDLSKLPKKMGCSRRIIQLYQVNALRLTATRSMHLGWQQTLAPCTPAATSSAKLHSAGQAKWVQWGVLAQNA